MAHTWEWLARGADPPVPVPLPRHAKYSAKSDLLLVLAFGHVKKAMIPVSSRGLFICLRFFFFEQVGFVYAVVWFAHKEIKWLLLLYDL